MNESIDSKIKKYTEDNKVYLYILTPCYGGICYVNYIQCLINTRELLKLYNINVEVLFCKNDSLVTRARNNLIAKAMYDEKMTHVLFIDNDITWDPIDILKLILGDKDIIGGIYPMKSYNWEKLSDPTFINKQLQKKNNSFFKNTPDSVMIQHGLLDYNLNYKSKNLSIKNNIIEVKHIATGFMLIKRNAINVLIKAYPSTKYTDDVSFLTGDENKYAYALFDCGVEDDHYYSEDWLFCHRWEKNNGSIYADVTINLTHTGTNHFNGSLLSNIIQK